MSRYGLGSVCTGTRHLTDYVIQEACPGKHPVTRRYMEYATRNTQQAEHDCDRTWPRCQPAATARPEGQYQRVCMRRKYSTVRRTPSVSGTCGRQPKTRSAKP